MRGEFMFLLRNSLNTYMYKYIKLCMVLFLLASMSITQAEAQTPPSDLDTYVIFTLDQFSFKGGNDGAGKWGYVLDGNVGVNVEDFESERPFCAGFVTTINAADSINSQSVPAMNHSSSA